jgi:hypothetical protein
MLGAAYASLCVDLELEQADVAHTLEMRSYRVRVKVQGLGDLRSGDGPARSSDLEIDGISSVVTQRLEDVEARHLS